MAYREKRIPSERRLNIRGKVDRAVFAVTAVATAIFWLSGSGAAMAVQELQEEGHGTELRVTRDVETVENGGIREPTDRCWDGDGKEYRLDSREIAMIPGQGVSRCLERKMVYTGVEGAEETPGSVSLKEDVSGSQAEGTPFLRKGRIAREEWQDGFTVPVTFHAYGADEYHGGSLAIPGDAILETCVPMGGQLLEFTGLFLLEYRILSTDWYGESYEDGEGRMCRQATAWGQKLLRDYKAEYEGEVSWIKSETQELKMVYRQTSVVSPAALETAQEAEHIPASEIQGEGPEGSLWYWVCSGFAIAVGAGLIGIGVGLLTLLAVWYRQNRRKHRRRCLSRIKD